MPALSLMREFRTREGACRQVSFLLRLAIAVACRASQYRPAYAVAKSAPRSPCLRPRASFTPTQRHGAMRVPMFTYTCRCPRRRSCSAVKCYADCFAGSKPAGRCIIAVIILFLPRRYTIHEMRVCESGAPIPRRVTARCSNRVAYGAATVMRHVTMNVTARCRVICSAQHYVRCVYHRSSVHACYRCRCRSKHAPETRVLSCRVRP